MEPSFVQNRITELRMKKGVSEVKMSYDLGHCRGYIQGISSGKAMPSMREFLYICEYFDITPAEFFYDVGEESVLIQEAVKGMRTLSRADLQAILTMIDRLNEK